MGDFWGVLSPSLNTRGSVKETSLHKKSKFVCKLCHCHRSFDEELAIAVMCSAAGAGL